MRRLEINNGSRLAETMSFSATAQSVQEKVAFKRGPKASLIRMAKMIARKEVQINVLIVLAATVAGATVGGLV